MSTWSLLILLFLLNIKNYKLLNNINFLKELDPDPLMAKLARISSGSNPACLNAKICPKGEPF
jgi:hypothetical protein